MTHLLDQPVWNALVSGNSNLSNGTSTAKYFDKTVAPFADVKDQNTDNFKILYDTVPNNQVIAVFSIHKICNLVHGLKSVGSMDCKWFIIILSRNL